VIQHSGSDRDGAVLVHISGDEMQATVDLFPHQGRGKPLDLDTVEYALIEAGVTNGIDRESLAEGIRKTEKGEEHVKGVVAALGTPAVNSVPRSYEFPLQPQIEHVDTQGKVDFRELAMFAIVHKNDVVARPVPRQDGKKGLTVTGKEIPFSDAVDEELEAGENISVLGNGQYVARDDGRLVRDKGSIRVESALLIEKDVDFSTGNIRFPKDVAVGGNVLDEFVVETNGNVTVKGLVGAASIYAKGSIEILGGFSGKGRGSVKSDGEVRVAFIDNGGLVCMRDLTVANEIVNSSVFSNGRVTCVGKKGAIIGGSVSARGGIECSIAGSERSHATRLEAGVDVLVASRLRKAEGLFSRLSDRISAVTFSLEEVAKRGAISPSLEKEHKELLKKLNEMVVIRERLKSDLYAPEGATIHVRSTVHTGVVISLCGVEKTIMEAMGPTTFSLDAEKAHVVTDKQAKIRPPATGKPAERPHGGASTPPVGKPAERPHGTSQ
jgi:uncharacterized protein (DUF342 family)